MNENHPALVASQASWRCVQAHDKQAWLDLMADDVHIEDPIGPGVTNPDGKGIRGKEAVADFYDRNIAPNNLSITCEGSFLASSDTEAAHVLSLRSEFDNGVSSTVRGIFTYRVDDEGKVTHLRAYWEIGNLKVFPPVG